MTNVFATFNDEHSLLAAARSAREEDLVIVDAYTPYPVHGLEAAMGIRRSRLTYACFFFGAAGLIGGLGFQLWVFVVNWAMTVGGTSLNVLPALIPVAFETAILFAALGTVVTFFAVARLFPGKRASLAAEGITDSQFVLAVESDDGERAKEFFEDQGAVKVEMEEIS